MRKLLFQLVVFVMPILLALLFVEYKLANMENSYSYKRKNLENKLDSIEVLVLGDSHTYFGVDPEGFDDYTFNLANVSQSLDVDSQLINMYVLRMPQLKYVFINVSYTSLCYRLQNVEDRWRTYFYEQYFGFNFKDTLSSLNPKHYSKIALYSPRVALYYLLKGFENGTSRKINQKGFYRTGDVCDSTGIDIKTGKFKAQEHTRLCDKGSGFKNIHTLEYMLRVFKSRNIKPIIITTPTYLTYYRNIDKDLWLKAQNDIEAVGKKYDVKYLNLLEDKRFDICDFVDNDHLNVKGAKKYSRILNALIK
jgi:hypothetical protein